MQFELWLMGQNAAVQKRYWEILKYSEWNRNREKMPEYSVLEVVLNNQIDFNDKEKVTKTIVNRSLELALNIQQYLAKVNV